MRRGHEGTAAGGNLYAAFVGIMENSLADRAEVPAACRLFGRPHQTVGLIVGDEELFNVHVSRERRNDRQHPPCTRYCFIIRTWSEATCLDDAILPNAFNEAAPSADVGVR